MRRIASVLLVALLAAPATASAQWGYVWAGGGMVMPMGDTSDGFKTGWIGSAGLGWTVPSMPAWSFQGELMYGSHSVKVGTGDVTMTTVMLNVAYDINATARAHPYIYAGVGSMSSETSYGSSTSTSDMAWHVAGGYSWKLNDRATFWAEARYLVADEYKSMPIVAGLSFPLGKKK